MDERESEESESSAGESHRIDGLIAVAVGNLGHKKCNDAGRNRIDCVENADPCCSGAFGKHDPGIVRDYSGDGRFEVVPHQKESRPREKLSHAQLNHNFWSALQKLDETGLWLLFFRRIRFLGGAVVECEFFRRIFLHLE